MTREKALSMIDEYLLQDNIDAGWVECLRFCKGEIESQKAEIEEFKILCDMQDKNMLEQKAEIERLYDLLDSSVSNERNVVDNIPYERNEAIKEFANLIRRRLNSNTPRGAYLINIVDDLVKEMTEQ